MSSSPTVRSAAAQTTLIRPVWKKLGGYHHEWVPLPLATEGHNCVLPPPSGYIAHMCLTRRSSEHAISNHKALELWPSTMSTPFPY